MRKLFLFALGVFVAGAPAVLAQNTDIEALAGINFNFSNPGARSMGMGGAFLGLADDASAAEANPAGLTILRKPEISLEGRNWRNALDVPVTGTFPDLVNQEFSSFSRAAELTFGSIVYPKGNFAVAVYYHQALNYENAASVLPEEDRFGRITRNVPEVFFPRGNPPGSAGPVSEDECRALPAGQCLTVTVLPFVTAVEVKMKTLGLAGAWKIGALSLGATARYHEFTEGAFTTRFFQGSLHSIAVQATALDNAGEPGTEDDITFTAGFKWTMNDKFSVGGVYKLGPEFDAPTFNLVPDVSEDFVKVADTKFHVPDIAGLGFSFKPLQALTINVDGVHITYSNLVDNFRTQTTGIVNHEGRQVLADPFEAKDATEIHVGAEYFFATTPAFAIRGGWWRDPAHSLTYVGPLTCNDDNFRLEDRLSCAANRITEAILFPEGKDQDHFSVGVGFAWPNFQIDAAYDTSDGFKVGSLSGVYRF